MCDGRPLPWRVAVGALQGVQLVVAVNQSATHALPAAISQATTALLRYAVCKAGPATAY